MKLSPETVLILKNFASINQSIYFRKGNRIRTMALARNVLAEATVAEDFQMDFAIYDLNQFINALSLHDNATLDFSHDSYVSFTEGNRKAKYFFADPAVIVYPPDKEIIIPTQDICFVLDRSDLDKIMRAANTYQIFDFSVIGNKSRNQIMLVVRDKNNPSSNEFSIIVGETDQDFVVNYRMENIKIISGTYDVVISKKLTSKFTNKDRPVTYYITPEPDSNFNEN